MVRRDLRECIERELELLEEREPMEEPGSDHRLRLFLVRDKNGAVQATTRRVGSDGGHDVKDILAVLDVTLQSDEYVVARCLQLFFDEEIPTDDDGGVDPDWPVDPQILADAHELAWERHCSERIDEWIDDALVQMTTERPSS